jgi:NAD-dependent SIR2 family protein deacetylase
LDNISFRELNAEDINSTRENIHYLISRMFDYLLQHDSKKEYINKFANNLVNKASVRIDNNYKNKDPVSVISTNWDILLDNSIKSAIDKNYADKAVVDYCCYVSSHRPDDETVMPGLEMLGRGGFNVKLLKLHGSLNWLQCPRCQRVYVDFFNKIAMMHFTNKVKCRHCEKNFSEDTTSHNLVSNLMMPTFLKNLSNPQYKLIWQNAGIELSEASKIVFIGYSLPQADFEMRQLLARMVRNNAAIEVVDFGEAESHNIIQMKKRYQVFFGKRDVKFHLDGAKSYIDNLVN